MRYDMYSGLAFNWICLDVNKSQVVDFPEANICKWRLRLYSLFHAYYWENPKICGSVYNSCLIIRFAYIQAKDTTENSPTFHCVVIRSGLICPAGDETPGNGNIVDLFYTITDTCHGLHLLCHTNTANSKWCTPVTYFPFTLKWS